MSHQRRFGNDGPPSTWPCKPKNRSDDMNEKDEDIAHGGIVSDLESRLFSGIGNSPSTRSAVHCQRQAQLVASRFEEAVRPVPQFIPGLVENDGVMRCE